MGRIKNLNVWVAGVSLGCLLTACSNIDNGIDTPDQPISCQQHTETSGTTVTNNDKIVVGLSDDDFIYSRVTDVLKPNGGGWVSRFVTDCAAMNDIPYVKGKNEVDTTRIVENVTLVNKGIIELHTKKIVELYEQQTNNPEIADDGTRPIEYLRVFGLCSTGKNCTVINEGTIEVYFDHDPNTPIWVYCFAMAGGEGCQIINKGTIKFRGNGSRRTRMRGIGVTGPGATAINEGTMDIDVAMAEDSRMITCGEDNCIIRNEGIMKGRVPGTQLGMTHYGVNDILNRGTIDLTSTPVPDGQFSIVDDAVNVVCAFYNVYNQTRDSIPPMINEGMVNIRIEGSETTPDSSQGYGMFFDLIGANRVEAGIINDGTIKLSQSGPKHYDMGEAGFMCRNYATAFACKVKLGHWKTELRDFGKTHDLFVAKGLDMNFTDSYIELVKPAGYMDGTAYSVAPEDLIYEASNGKFKFNYSGYDQMTFRAADSDHVGINWDKEQKTVSLVEKGVTVSTTTAGDNYYQGLPLQIGLAGSTDIIAEAIVDIDGKAVFNTGLKQFAGKDIWFCVPKMVKFFHQVSEGEAAANMITLPDKDKGSTVDATGLKNDWIVALYMGINKDGKAGGTPLYWATGNLLAVKTNAIGKHSEVAYHIATAEETEMEGTAGNSLVMMDNLLVANVPDGYAKMPAGSTWDMFAFGDVTGLMLYDEDHIDQYCIDTKQMSEDKTNIVFDISGDARFDAARAQLGGLWRLPTGGISGENEFAPLEDSVEEYAALLPDGVPYGQVMVNFGIGYDYAVSMDGIELTTNSLKLPATGYRHATEIAAGTAAFCLYWSGTADPTGTPGYEPDVEKTGQTVDIWNTAFNYGFLNRQRSWFVHPRTSSQSIRPVTE